MKYKELELHASSCQMAADEMAIKLLAQQRIYGAISIFQDACDFNLAWLYQLSPEVVLHVESLEFLADNVRNFKRKITISEIFRYDFIIRYNEIKDFNKFKTLLT